MQPVAQKFLKPQPCDQARYASNPRRLRRSVPWLVSHTYLYRSDACHPSLAVFASANLVDGLSRMLKRKASTIFMPAVPHWSQIRALISSQSFDGIQLRLLVWIRALDFIAIGESINVVNVLY